MGNDNQKVIGSYSSKEEAIQVISRLKEEGYPKQDIIVYGNEQSAKGSVDSNKATTISASDPDYTDQSSTKEDRSAWDKIKDAFTRDSYESSNANSKESEDILYPYRDDIKKGNLVIVVQNPQQGDQNVDRDSSSDQNVDRRHLAEPNAVTRADDPLTGGRQFDRADPVNDNTHENPR